METRGGHIIIRAQPAIKNTPSSPAAQHHPLSPLPAVVGLLLFFLPGIFSRRLLLRSSEGAAEGKRRRPDDTERDRFKPTPLQPT